jgi:ankyrin repeat protein
MLNLVIDPKAREALVRANDGYMSNSLHHACIGGNANIVSLLLKNGAQMNTVDVGIQTPLHYACMYGHMNCVQVLLQAGISAASTAAGTAFINTTNIGGRTPLHYACSSGSAKCVELLLTMNAHMAEGGKYVFEGLNLQDNDGATPLHLACRKVHADCALYLIAANASLDIVDMKGESPLLIVCEKINEPKHSFAALHVVEKLMSAGADVQEKTELNEERKLVIDRIHSKNLRRELEILYLRQEVQRSRKKNDILSNELLQAQEHLKHLHQSQIQLKQFLEKQKLLYEQTSSDLHQKQSEIEQLQCQVKNILQFLQAVPIGTIPQVPANVSPINGLTNFAIPGVYSNEISEEEKAQEAALARDIAKKHYRNKKYAIAESYFEKSLEIFPLPGVYRMLVQTRQQRLEIDKLLEVERQQQQHLQTKETLMNEFRKAMANCKAPPHAIQSIENELQKMEHLEQDSAQFSMAQKWLEWLLSLPWETSTYFTKDSAGFHMEVFTKIEEIERENARAKESVAARVIQNAFREHFAVHLMNREKAAALVQAAWRGYRVRGQWEEITQKQIGLRFLARKEKETSAQVFTKEVIYKKAECSLKDSICKEPVKPVNYETDIDPKALSRLAAREKTSSIKQDIAESMITLGRAAHLIDGSLSSFHITQLIELQPLNQYYIWYRWGKDTSQQCESVLRGPYEEPEVAENEYEKSLKGKIAQGYFSMKELSCNSMSESLKLENAKMFAGHLHCPTITS